MFIHLLNSGMQHKSATPVPYPIFIVDSPGQAQMNADQGHAAGNKKET